MIDKPVTPMALFTSEGTDACPDYPALCGGRCMECGRTMFPLQSYGCESCGSTDTEPFALSGRGQLVASAGVFIAAGPHHPAPFTIGSIAQEDGVKVRAILDVAPGTRLAPGTIMVARLVPETRPDRGAFDLRFTPAQTDGA